MDNQFIPDWPSARAGGVVKKEWEDGYENGYQAGMAEKKPWVGLTDEEWQEIADKTDIIIWSKLKEAIEAKLREKNSG